MTAEHLFLARKLLVGNTQAKALLLFLHFILQHDPCPAGPQESREGGARWPMMLSLLQLMPGRPAVMNDISKGRPAGDIAYALLKQHPSHSAVDETK